MATGLPVVGGRGVPSQQHAVGRAGRLLSASSGSLSEYLVLTVTAAVSILYKQI